MSAERPGSLRLGWDALGRHGTGYLIAEGIAKGGIYLLFIWLATLMSVEDFGLLNVFVSLLGLIGMGVSLGLGEGVFRMHFAADDTRGALAWAMGLPIAIGMLLLLPLILWGSPVATVLNVPLALLILAVAAAPLVALRQVWLTLSRARFESGRYLVTRVLEFVLFLIGVLVVVFLARSIVYEEIALAYVLALAGVAAWGVVNSVRRVGLQWSTAPIRRLLIFSLPLVAHGLAMTGLALFDQVVLQQLLGSEATGTYAFAYRFGMAMYLFVFAFGAAWGPLVLKRMSAGQGESLRPLADTAFRFMLVSSVVIAWVLPFLARWMGGARYAESLPLIPMIVYAYLWVGFYGLGVGYLYFRNRSVILAMASGLAFLANAGLNYLTIPRWGVAAAATTTMVSYMLLAFLVWSALGRDRVELPWGRFAVQMAVVTPVLLSASFVYL